MFPPREAKEGGRTFPDTQQGFLRRIRVLGRDPEMVQHGTIMRFSFHFKMGRGPGGAAFHCADWRASLSSITEETPPAVITWPSSTTRLRATGHVVSTVVIRGCPGDREKRRKKGWNPSQSPRFTAPCCDLCEQIQHSDRDRIKNHSAACKSFDHHAEVFGQGERHGSNEMD